MDEGARISAAAAQHEHQCQTNAGVHVNGDGGTSGREKHRSGRTSALREPYGLEKSHANATWRGGAIGGGSTASFRCRRIFLMTLTSVIGAGVRSIIIALMQLC